MKAIKEEFLKEGSSNHPRVTCRKGWGRRGRGYRRLNKKERKKCPRVERRSG